MEFCADGTCVGVFDTGTSLVSVPTSAFAEVFTKLRHPSSLKGDCQGPGPDWQIEIEGDNYTLTLGPRDYALPQSVDSGSAPSFGGNQWHSQMRRTDNEPPLSTGDARNQPS